MAKTNGGAMQRYQQSAQSRPARQPNDLAPITNRGAEQNFIGEGASTQMMAAGATLQRAQNEFFTAVQVQVPRNKKDVIRRVVEEMCLAPDGMMYSWTVKSKNGKKTTVEGPSVKMTNSIVSEYMNCTQAARLVSEDKDSWLIDGVFVDLERGVMTKRQFRQRKDQGAKAGKYDSERALDIAFQIGQSKAMRNAVVNAIPYSILSRAIDAVKQQLGREIAQKSGGDIVQSRKSMLDTFKKRYNVTPEQIEYRMRVYIDELQWEDLGTLRNIYKAIQDGETTVEAEFTIEEAEAPAAIAVPQEPKEEPKEASEASPEDGELVIPKLDFPEVIDPNTGEVVDPERSEEPGGDGTPTDDDDLPY